MSRTNQMGEPVVAGLLDFDDMTDKQFRSTMKEFFSRYNLYVVETNATKHGVTEIKICQDEEELNKELGYDDN